MRELTVLPQLEFTEALKAFWNKIAQFQGRSRRSEFWWTYLAYFVTSIIFSFVPIIGNIVTLLFGLAIIPITFRRLHDTGRSGWCSIISLTISTAARGQGSISSSVDTLIMDRCGR